MIKVPDWFQQQLDLEHNRRLRVRWSVKRGLWQIEAKRFRGKMLDRPLTSEDDAGIRERDGYDLVCEIAPGPRVPCPRCRRALEVPVQRWKEVTCQACRGRLLAPWFPFTDTLLERLRYIDPDRGGVERVFREADDHEARREASLRRERHRILEALVKEDRRKLLEQPLVGFNHAQGRFPFRVPDRRHV